ncbi:uridine-cytidine kinase 2-like [Zophobas morio]|uniref:uridine-cytidine kinase 2-like n=1 Tax=Zophobas morio TaxID=2755281 RepID=UPI0030830745
MGGNRSRRVDMSSTDSPFLIGVSGGTASGKTTVCRKIIEGLEKNDLGLQSGEDLAVIIHQVSFYRPIDIEKVDVNYYNFDNPTAFDFKLIVQVLSDLRSGKEVDVPIYDQKTYTRSSETCRVCPKKIILFEGILCFDCKELRDLFHLKIFVDCDNDTRLAKRVLRDLKKRNRDLDSILKQYIDFVKPAYDDFIQPSKKYADIIIPRGADNLVAIDFIIQYIKEHCKQPVANSLDTKRLLREHYSFTAAIEGTLPSVHTGIIRPH